MNLSDQCQVAVKLAAALRSQWWNPERIRAFQNQALVRMMRHAATQVPFYQRLQLDPKRLISAADLQRFPLINKRDIQNAPDDFIAAGFVPGRLDSSRTSGSSGQPTSTYFDRSAWLLTKYVLKMRRIVATAGMPWLKRVLIISEQAPQLLAASTAASPSGLGFLFQQRRLSIHTPIEQHLREIARYRPQLIYAYPSYLLDLIAAATRRGQALPQIGALYTSSEVLTAASRQRIESAFGGRLYDVYGSTEFKEVAWQCQHGRYHFNFESTYVEAQSPGAAAPVVMSSLCNVAMPLLRFDIGDRASFSPQSCPCGRAPANVAEFSGREGDMITLPSRRRLSPYLLTMAIESENSILQYRIVQTQSDAFRIDVVVRAPGQSASWQSRLCAELKALLGEPIDVRVREVDVLERAPSGKRSVFVRAHAALD